MPTVSNAGCSIWYDTFGEGPPLVMVYGIGNNSRRWWDAFPARLAERYRVTILDNRGVGRSDRPEAPWTIADMIGDVHAVVSELGLQSYHLLGCSLGSVIVRHYAAAHGDELRSLSLLCPPNGIQATPEDMKLAIFWDPEKPRVENERASWPVVHPEAWAQANDSELLADFELAESERTPSRTYFFQMQATAAAGDANGPLNAFDWPVLVLHGTVDRLVPPDNARTLKAAVPRAKLEWLVGASHTFWQHEPDGAADVVLDFLGSAETRAREGA